MNAAIAMSLKLEVEDNHILNKVGLEKIAKVCGTLNFLADTFLQNDMAAE